MCFTRQALKLNKRATACDMSQPSVFLHLVVSMEGVRQIGALLKCDADEFIHIRCAYKQSPAEVGLCLYARIMIVC